MSAPDPSRRHLLLVLSIAAALRCAALPFAMTPDPDAVSRVLIAQDWLASPKLITHGVWGPLHFYLLAAVIRATGSPVYGPIALNIALSIATAYVLYGFVRREWGEPGSLFVASAYAFFPLAFQNSIQALAEPPFVFFVALALSALSKVRSRDRDARGAAEAGLWVTCACALRFEGWLLVPLLAATLWGRRREMVLFLLVAGTFPLFWLVSSFLGTGDPLYSMHSTEHWQINVEGENERVTVLDYAIRAVRFPSMLFFGLTPVVGLLCIAGVRLCRGTRPRLLVWLVPFVGLLLFFVLQTLQGALGPARAPRYCIVLGLLILPFAGPAWVSIANRTKHARLAAVAVIGTMLPLSYTGRALAAAGVGSAFQVFPSGAVPRETARVKRVDAELSRRAQLGTGGLLLDFWAWDETYYVGLTMLPDPRRLFIMPGGRHETLDDAALAAFFVHEPRGVAVLKHASPLGPQTDERGASLRFDAHPEIHVVLENPSNVGDLTVFDYSVQN